MGMLPTLFPFKGSHGQIEGGVSQGLQGRAGRPHSQRRHVVVGLVRGDALQAHACPQLAGQAADDDEQISNLLAGTWTCRRDGETTHRALMMSGQMCLVAVGQA